MRLSKTKINAVNAVALLGVVAALATGAVALSGCGASATLDPVAQAAEVTSRQAGARISLSVQFSSPELPSGFGITASGYIATRQRAETLNMSFTGVPGLSSASGSGSAQLVFLYPVLYMNMPALAGHLPEGKTWMEIDLSKAAQAAGAGSDLSSLDQFDPSQYLSYLRASSGSVVPVDKETVNGALTTHYRVSLEVSHIVEHLPGEQQAAAKAALEKLGVSGSIPVDVWVDAQGRVRREVLSFGGAGSGAGASSGAGETGTGASGAATGLSGTVTVDFLSFGTVPPVAAPPASEVFDATALTTAGAQGGAGGL
jgi:hypothetical protein